MKYEEGQIEPLGINGESLLKLLKAIQSKSPEQFPKINEVLQLFDWYDSFELPDNLIERAITIKDRYLTKLFNQRSANMLSAGMKNLSLMEWLSVMGLSEIL